MSPSSVGLGRLGAESFNRYLFKFSSVTFQHSLPACVVLPALHDHVDILWIKFYKSRLPARGFARDECRARPPEGIKYHGAPVTTIPNGSLDQVNRLHGGVQIVDGGLVYRSIRRPDREPRTRNVQPPPPIRKGLVRIAAGSPIDLT